LTIATGKVALSIIILGKDSARGVINNDEKVASKKTSQFKTRVHYIVFALCTNLQINAMTSHKQTVVFSTQPSTKHP